jgi:predicted transcriptional regulator
MFSHLDGIVLGVGYQERCKRHKFGKEFKEIRESLGLSIPEAAAFMNISAGCVSRIERGLVDPDTPNFRERMDYMISAQKMVISL